MDLKYGLTKESIALLLSAILECYYLFLQDFLDVYLFVVIPWSILNLALVYRVVVQLTKTYKQRKQTRK